MGTLEIRTYQDNEGYYWRVLSEDFIYGPLYNTAGNKIEAIKQAFKFIFEELRQHDEFEICFLYRKE